MIGFFVTLAVLLLALTAVVLVMKNQRCQHHDKETREQGIKKYVAENINLRNLNS